MRALLLFFLTAVALSGCTVDPVNSKYTPMGTEPQLIGAAYQVTPSDKWRHYSSTNDVDFRVHWTSGKYHRASIAFYHDLGEGDALFRYTDPDFPLVRADMTAEDVATLLRESLKLRGVLSIETKNIGPAKFGGHEGFKFSTSYVRADGVPGRGIAQGTIINGRLQLIYFATGGDWFDDYVDDAERVMASVELQ